MAGKSGTFSDTGSQVNVTVTGGTVTTTGSPAANELAGFSGATAITNIPNSSFDAVTGNITVGTGTPQATTTLTINSQSGKDALDLNNTGVPIETETPAVLNIASKYVNPQSGSAVQVSTELSDDVGNGGQAAFSGGTNLTGSNGDGDVILAYYAQVNSSSTGGTPAEMTQYYIDGVNISLQPPNILAGIHALDLNSSGHPALVTNAAILIENQTPGANVYSIKTGIGPVGIGDVMALTPVAFSGLPSSPVLGMLIPITDANTTTFGATISAGSGSGKGLAYYDGTNWTFR